MNDPQATHRNLGKRAPLDQLGRQGSRRGAKPLLGSLLAALAFSLPLSASTLEEKSPFLPAGYNNKKEAPKPPPVQKKGQIAREVEFRGSVEMDGAFKVSLFNKADQKSYWIKVGEEKEGIKVTAFDPESMAVTLNQSGRTERLSLKDPTDSPMPVAVSAPPAAPSRVQPKLPPALQNTANNNNNNSKRKTIPRRRVILPKK